MKILGASLIFAVLHCGRNPKNSPAESVSPQNSSEDFGFTLKDLSMYEKPDTASKVLFS